MKKILLSITTIIVVLLVIVVFRATTVFENNQYQVTESLTPIALDKAAAIDRFSLALQIPTISYDDTSKFDHSAFLAFHQHLAQSFPLAHAKTQLTKFNDYSMVFHLKGQNPQLKPALFMGHMDVVPVDEQTKDQWLQPPFSGKVTDGAIWGRGAIDDKVSVLALMESLEWFLTQNKVPQRDVYFAFGHDEEVGGEGAKAIAKYFAEQNIQFEFVLDEGGVITEGIIPGATQPLALVGVAEKGIVNFRLTVKGEGGHSSQPPAHTAAGILASAIVKVENNPFDARLEFFDLMFDNIGYSMPLSKRLPLANLWLFEPLILNTLLNSPISAASSRTTTAVTMLQGSTKSNVLPTIATAVVNFRILPGDTIKSIQAHLERVIDDPRVTLSTELANEASAVSPTDNIGFKLIESSIRRLDDNVLVTPYLVVAATDSRHFQNLSDNIYRFMMVSLNPETLKQFHGLNEQIAVKDYLNAIQFYYAMLEQTASGKPHSS
ncbi:M20 family peptidase [Paraglaciecola arctica]|uniref:Carboxypeptidase PM20D1 n=1 Tax=Paraglaciecola arctica BSs20135 TaxID=493475 RepID=K6YK53_9ALTE|nr:M20 family peptidase [Paraglaciecola arctica]GAC16988.1 carboxypeptidase PM20D1 [Paraglaciecola arctica BSs20135]